MARSTRRRGSGEEVRAALSRIRKGEVASVYFLHGPEPFLRDEMVREIRNNWQFFRDRRPETYEPLLDLN